MPRDFICFGGLHECQCLRAQETRDTTILNILNVPSLLVVVVVGVVVFVGVVVVVVVVVSSC